MKETLLNLAQRIEDERKAIIEALGTGMCKDYAQYQQACGKVLGLLTVSGIIAEELRRMREDGDDD